MPWIRRFSKAGGKVIISGDTDIMKEPHERLALLQEGMVVFFFTNQWSNWKFFPKCALLLHWWPRVVKKVEKAKPGTFWRIPAVWDIDHRLESVTTEDKKLLKVRRQRAAQPVISAARRARRQPPPIKGQLPLFPNPGDDRGEG